MRNSGRPQGLLLSLKKQDFMKKLFGQFLLLSSFIIAASCMPNKGKGAIPGDKLIDRSWKEGTTLPPEVFSRYPLPQQQIQDDNGINVMIDLVHQCKFATMWGLPERLNNHGFRAIGNQAALNSVLSPEGFSRVRLKWDEQNRIYPFAWHRNFTYNVIITNQSDTRSQDYLPEEQEALVQFVNEGGGLLIMAPSPPDEDIASSWTLNQLCNIFGAALTPETEIYRNIPYSVVSHDEKWSVRARGENGKPVHITRPYGRGFVTIMGHDELLQTNRNDPAEVNREKDSILMGEILDLAAGKDPVGGEPRYPVAGGGGGGIYPELEKKFDDIVLFYAANQKEELLRTIDEDIPVAKKLVETWLPSRPTLEPMYLILSSGGGGGWAVNAFRPKENGIISLSPSGILSIFAHELAHTMHGPVNDKGDVAGLAPIPGRGEAHAGWFQGKVDAWFSEELKNKPVKNCNSLFDFDTTGNMLDLVKCFENEELREKWGKGKDWTKTWWIWQKLDDRYGLAWYPRWKYVQHTRWADDPEHRLTWDEMAEDMSVAVGEDLFPFLRSAGLSLEKERFEKGVFKGREIELPVAPIRADRAGNAVLEGIVDYKNTLTGSQKPVRRELIEPYHKDKFQEDDCVTKNQGGKPVTKDGFLVFNGATDGNRQVDPQVAVGGGYVFHGTNTGLYIYDKNGSFIDGVSQNCFLGGIDPKLFYNHHQGVFGFDLWVYWDSLKIKPVNIAISETGDPSGAWNIYPVPAPHGVDGGGIGYSRKWVAYSFPGGRVNTFVLKMDDLIKGIPATAFHFSGSLGQPVFTHDRIDDLFFVNKRGGKLIISKITEDKNGDPIVLSVSSREHGLQYDEWPPQSPQKGTEQLTASGDRNPKNIIFQNGYLWFSHAVNVDGRSAVQWHQFTPEGEIIQSGLLKHPTNSYIQTTIGVNSQNDVVVGFQETGPGMYISPRMAFRYADDPPGELREIISLGEGAGPTEGVAWGDYSGTCIDGDNLLDIWTVQSIANERGRGETVIARVPFKKSGIIKNRK